MIRVLIDAGNTNIKFALVDSGNWLSVDVIPSNQAGELHRFLVNYHDVKQVWVSNVAGEVVAQHIRTACARLNLLPRFITARTLQCGVTNRYTQPAQLGADRWAALIAARQQRACACLVVCSGTATTIDALSDQGEFLGGLILPGIELMQRSLFESTAKLSVLVGKYVNLPLNTADAILSGALQATLGAVQRQYAVLAVPDAPVILGGGAASSLFPHITYPVEMMDNLVLNGLLCIAQEVEV